MFEEIDNIVAEFFRDMLRHRYFNIFVIDANAETFFYRVHKYHTFMYLNAANIVCVLCFMRSNGMEAKSYTENKANQIHP